MITLATTEKSNDRIRGAAGWLCLAASPTFAVMAWIAAIDAARMPTCGETAAMLPIDGMAWMYLLMSLFHAPAWLRRVSSARNTSPIR